MSVIFKRTKILATLGPPTNNYETIEKMAKIGVDGFRLNFSHGNFEERDQQIEWIREASKKNGKPVAILQDLQGPKIRLGILSSNIDVKQGDEIILDHAVKEHDGSLTLPIQYNLAPKVKIGELIYIFDGKVRTTVTEIVSDTAIKVRVENDGTLMSRKGLNLPDTDFAGDIITAKDMEDIKYGVTKDIDYVALSFVQSADDIVELRKILDGYGSKSKIITKVETKAAIEDSTLEEIVKVSDGIMVARGDLAYEVATEVVPIAQRKMLALCRKHGKFCIVATQTMGSMVSSPEPSRAEVSDVANAVIQGADIVMLSDETANGSYPIETVTSLEKIILHVQQYEEVADVENVLEGQQDAVSAASVVLAEKMNADAIIVETKTGNEARNVAAHRPNLPIISVTTEPRVAQQLALIYANRSFIRSEGDDAGLNLAKELKASGCFGDKDQIKVVIVSGDNSEIADTVRVRTV